MRNVARPFDPRQDERQGALASALDAARRRPVDTFAGLLAAACTVMILVNALALQEGRRPGTSPTAEDAAHPAGHASSAPRRNELVAQIQGALADLKYYDGPVDGLMGAQTASAIRAFEQAERLAQTGEASERVLAAALTAPPKKAEAASSAGRWTQAEAPKAAPAPARPAPTAQAAPATTGAIAPPKLMAVQKALAKIGYGPVTIDGKMGAETRSAIQSFERDRDLPVTGEPSPQVLKALQAMTGAPLQ
ncbi:peptidoglycan-binding protein [Hansschlegelia sp. KR7-227]|uniref:peptidoglycan-binding domain-containing protein n=1 Tax=Hansschlegelia sp. KR7-227 TaxID=3400914 RepID=UPI003C0C4C3C